MQNFAYSGAHAKNQLGRSNMQNFAYSEGRAGKSALPNRRKSVEILPIMYGRISLRKITPEKAGLTGGGQIG